MRREPTDAEDALWRLPQCKRLAGYKFRPQQRLEDKYVVDFVCFDRRVILKADGSRHAERDYDAQRDAWPREHACTILRFWSNDVLAPPENVMTAILCALESGNAVIAAPLPVAPFPGPPPHGGREKKDDIHG
jgi:very-short-patch-repair endonuclease